MHAFQVGAVFLLFMETARRMTPGLTAGTWLRPCQHGGHESEWLLSETSSMLWAGMQTLKPHLCQRSAAFFFYNTKLK